MQKLLITSVILAITALAATKAMAQSDPSAGVTPDFRQGTTQAGLARQAALPPMDLLTAIFLDMDASRAAGVPVARDTTTFEVGEQIAVYTKFANVGRTNPGAVDGFMWLTSDLHVSNSAGETIIDQPINTTDLDSVPFPYDGAIPDAYFDSFKLAIFALQTPDTYTLTLTFDDRTRPITETAPVVVTMEATLQ